jgi:hypothetical protein
LILKKNGEKNKHAMLVVDVIPSSLSILGGLLRLRLRRSADPPSCETAQSTYPGNSTGWSGIATSYPTGWIPG